MDNIDYFRRQPDIKNAVAYCHNKKHIGYLSEKYIKSHKCLEKQCVYLERIGNNSFWARREIIRFLKKNKKNNIKGGISINGKRYMTTDPTILSDIYMTCMNETGEIPYMECWG